MQSHATEVSFFFHQTSLQDVFFFSDPQNGISLHSASESKETKLTDSEEDINKLEVRTRPQDPFLFPRTPSTIFWLCRLQAIYYVFD